MRKVINRRASHNRRCSVYRLYDSQGVLLYVGIANDPGRRMSQHQAEKPWWPQVAHVDIEWHPARLVAERAEQAAIASENPLHNIQHAVASPVKEIRNPEEGDAILVTLKDGRTWRGEITGITAGGYLYSLDRYDKRLPVPSIFTAFDVAYMRSIPHE